MYSVIEGTIESSQKGSTNFFRRVMSMAAPYAKRRTSCQTAACTTARRSIKLLKNGTPKSHPGYPHGTCAVHAHVINADFVAFIKN